MGSRGLIHWAFGAGGDRSGDHDPRGQQCDEARRRGPGLFRTVRERPVSKEASEQTENHNLVPTDRRSRCLLVLLLLSGMPVQALVDPASFCFWQTVPEAWSVLPSRQRIWLSVCNAIRVISPEHGFPPSLPPSFFLGVF